MGGGQWAARWAVGSGQLGGQWAVGSGGWLKPTTCISRSAPMPRCPDAPVHVAMPRCMSRAIEVEETTRGDMRGGAHEP